MIAHLPAVKNACRFINECVVVQTGVGEGRRNSGNKVPNNAHGFHVSSARLNPILELTIRAIVRKVGKEQLR
jgi:hypothetical protein